MDKYEYNLKLEEIDKLVDQGDYEEAADLADTIEWKRVRNVRTLCLISEIYEAADRLEDSKRILERAYRKAPVGKNLLYRLVEVTTALHQYDEALEYYTEYVQAAPHDNNRYILKYKLYRGRGSSVEELIAILEEYLGQEYTERWAYELAKLYQQAGQMQKCLATCDDLVLWFHSGKYVLKALELKKKYAALTPKQQQIFEECIQEEAEDRLELEQEEEPEETVVRNIDSTDGEVIAEKIIAETEREIAEQVAASKAVIDQSAQLQRAAEPAAAATRKLQPQPAAVQEQGQDRTVQKMQTASTDGKTMQPAAEAVRQAQSVSMAEERPPMTQEELQMNFARSMREIISGVVKRSEVPEEDLPASVESRPKMTQRVEVPEQQGYTAGRLSIDDILLSMGDRGKEIAAKAAQASGLNADQMTAAAEGSAFAGAQGSEADQMTVAAEGPAFAGDQGSEADQMTAAAEGSAFAGDQGSEADQMTAAAEGSAFAGAQGSEAQASSELSAQEQPDKEISLSGKTISEAVVDELTDVQREALQYTNHPEKLLRNKHALPTYTEEEDSLGSTRRAPSREELMEAAHRALMSEKTIRIPEDGSQERLHRACSDEQPAERAGDDYAQDSSYEQGAEKAYAQDSSYEQGAEKACAQDSSYEQGAEKADAQDSSYEQGAEKVYVQDGRYDQEAEGDYAYGEEAGDYEENGSYDPEAEGDYAYGEETGDYEDDGSYDPEAEGDYAYGEEAGDYEGDGSYDPEAEGDYAYGEEAGIYEDDGSYDSEENNAYDDYLRIPEHLRNLFSGFAEIPELEDQIANAIIQAEAKGDDRTSKSGNILIFGAHSSGKTTLAMNLAKAITQDRGSQVVKMAKIYASDLNKKDIAATVAKIAGGTLIIEEAGDLEDDTVEQLTTAMEFRTDGLIVILEDEQRYVHELLMRHPRFTMKFTAQIYIPEYTLEELAMFGQIYANEQDYVIGDEGLDALYERISELADSKAAAGEAVTIKDVIDLVAKAIERSNGFFRKMKMGKKRYDESDFVILFAKDFK